MHKPGKEHQSKIHKMMRDSGYKVGGRMPGAKNLKKEISKEEHESGEKPTKLKDGGSCDSGKSAPRLDKLARGGKPKKHTKVNVNIIHPGGAAPMAPAPMPMDPTAAPMPGMQPGMKRGGRTKLASGGKVNVNVISPKAQPVPVPVMKPPVAQQIPTPVMRPTPMTDGEEDVMPSRNVPLPSSPMKDGGRLKMTAGAGSGEGRLEKAGK